MVVHEGQEFVAGVFAGAEGVPSMALVLAPECCFSTPRIIMQK
ncbi:MAG TPA: hypothetical protein VME43_06625 [Bryobacteraceae bacterium]|nr:hypothetical protein [Bryobacteraceae bacterium]